MKTKTFYCILLFCSCAIFFSSCEKDPDEELQIQPKTGSWKGDYTNLYENTISFYIKDSKITKTGSPDERSITIVLPFSNVTMTKYFYDDIFIVNGSFTFTYGSKTSVGGLVTIQGTFTSENACSGTATYDENSSLWNANASYNWVASPQ